MFLIALGIFASNGWLPKTDPNTGKKTGWFGKELPANASSSWNPFAPPLPSTTPQLSKEYIYAGGRLLAAEDANSGATPAPTPYGTEGDVASRQLGDGVFLSNDAVMERRFVTGLENPQSNPNEYQRADTAPRSTLGDCELTSADIVQVNRYVAGLDPLTPAGGPTGPSPCGSGPQGSSQTAGNSAPEPNSATTASNREILVQPANGRRGESITVPVFMKLDGDEQAVTFTLEYDTARLSNPRVALGENLPASAVLTVNTNLSGKIGILVDAEQVFASNPRQIPIVFITFDIRPNAPNGLAPINLTDSLARKSVSDRLARLLVTNYANGSIGVTP